MGTFDIDHRKLMDLWESNVELDSNDHIIGWNNINHNLKVSIGSRRRGAAPFTIGPFIQDVIDGMGTPTSIRCSLRVLV